jgi:F-type H+-transporting ATPase subunit b
MLPLLIAATDAVQAGAAEQLVSQFGIEWRYIVWQIASFLILFAVLYKFGIKPTVATMEERNKKIESGLRHAEETQARLAAAAQESAQIVKNAQLYAQKVVE